MSEPHVLSRHTLHHAIHGELPWAALSPAVDGPLPVCLFLYGGGGSVDTLEAIAPLLAAAWSSGRLPPIRVACAGVPPFCFYLDDAGRGLAWESVVAESLLDAVRAHFGGDGRAGLLGVSMGGYGALKIAFQRPGVFDAVAAVAPMLEPALRAGDTPLRNRFHYPPDVPQALLGAERDAALFERDHPACRARRNARELRERGLAIWLDAGSRDACQAHDGTELLHRVLWELDVPHEYHLLRDADHVGASLPSRLDAAFAFVAHHLGHPAPGPDPEVEALRGALAGARAEAAVRDPSLARCYGRLPSPRTGEA